MRFALPLIALAAAAAPAVAVAADETVTVRIAFDDLDITTAEGRAALEARIDAKLRRACSRVGVSTYSYRGPYVNERCVADARSTALAEVERIAAAKARRALAVAAN